LPHALYVYFWKFFLFLLDLSYEKLNVAIPVKVVKLEREKTLNTECVRFQEKEKMITCYQVTYCFYNKILSADNKTLSTDDKTLSA
jgi:hypothetical protein